MHVERGVDAGPAFDEFAISENFEDHQAAGGRAVVTVDEAFEVWNNNPHFRRNRRSGRAQYLMIGLTDGGRLVTVALVEGHRPGLWVAWTAWDTKETDW